MGRWVGCRETLVKWSEGLRIYNFKCQLGEHQSPQMVSGMFRETKFSLSCWLDSFGEGTGLRVSADAVVTSASMFVVHGKATVQEEKKKVVYLLLVLGLWLCSQHRTWIFVFRKYCSYQNLLVPELQNSFPICCFHLSFPSIFLRLAGNSTCSLLPAYQASSISGLLHGSNLHFWVCDANLLQFKCSVAVGSTPP